MSDSITPVFKSTVIKEFNEEDRTARFIASDDSVDRYGDIVEASGWDTKDFVNNPQFLFGHRSSALPIGSVTRTWRKGNQFMADVEFAPAGLDKFADKCFAFLKAGLLRAVSVGFVPISREPMYDDEGRWIGTHFLKQSLLELSLVPLPANTNALQVAKSLELSDQELDLFFSADTSKLYEVANARSELEVLRMRLSM